MKTKTEIEERLAKYSVFKAGADVGSERELVLVSAIDELNWVLRKG
jgi:hypothetical protein